jgi:hypothetical protein
MAAAAAGERRMLTRDILFGLNILSLVGFVAMMAGLNLGRSKQVRPLVAAMLMGAGTVLVFAGLYAGGKAG